MFTSVVPEYVTAVGVQLESAVLRIVDAVATHSPQMVLVPPAGSDEGSLLAAANATAQGIDMFGQDLHGIYHIARSASSILEIGADYLSEDSIAASIVALQQ